MHDDASDVGISLKMHPATTINITTMLEAYGRFGSGSDNATAGRTLKGNKKTIGYDAKMPALFKAMASSRYIDCRILGYASIHA